MDSVGIGLGWLTFVAVILGIVLLIAWILLPFAMIGTKPLLRELLKEQKETNRLLAARTIEAPVSSLRA
jgi:hypothetical protein